MSEVTLYGFSTLIRNLRVSCSFILLWCPMSEVQAYRMVLGQGVFLSVRHPCTPAHLERIHVPLPSEEATTLKVLRICTRKPRQVDSGCVHTDGGFQRLPGQRH